MARLLPAGLKEKIPTDGPQRRPLGLLLPHHLFRTHAAPQPGRGQRLLHAQRRINCCTLCLCDCDAHRLDGHVEGPQQGRNPGKIVVFNIESQTPSRREAAYGPRRKKRGIIEGKIAPQRRTL